MIFFRFLFSKFFLKQLALALLIGVALIVLTLKLIEKITYHDQTLVVPDLQLLPLAIVDTILQNQQLRYEVLDSAKYNPGVPPLAVTEQNPKAGERVKLNRKIYLTVNPSGYRKITVPNLIQITKRNAESLLKSTGFELGELIYRDNIGKDMVLEIQFKGNKIEPGILLPKTSKIDLVLGNGKR